MDFFVQMVLPKKWIPQTGKIEGLRRYRRIWWYAVTLTVFVSITPLIIMTGVNHYQYRRSVKAEIRYDITRALSTISRSIDYSIEVRLAALKLLIEENSRDELADDNRLAGTLDNLRGAFGGFVDLGLVDKNGIQVHYTGPYNLEGINYRDQEWFGQVVRKGVYVSDVFMGHRRVPHFVIAVLRRLENGDFFILRATVDMESLNSQISLPDLQSTDDVFIINHEGVLQTPSRFHGELLQPGTIPVPPPSTGYEVLEDVDENGGKYVRGYFYIPDSPFILVIVKKRENMLREWFRIRTELLSFLLVSIVLTLIVILWSSTNMVKHIRAADRRRTALLLNVEYTNKMATIGRLAASVAHEINNPLAIINEKAGLLRDLATFTEDYPNKQKTLEAVDSIINSVERCSGVTHRLLGFTRKLKVRKEMIDLKELLKEVMSFLGKEAEHRNITVTYHFPEDIPEIESARGLLQQVFLNLINNSFAAVKKGGRIDLYLEKRPGNLVAVTIQDNGCGISEENLKHIFEPFFSTKGDFGTGLGLSITYGIVQKLGGKISVKSKLGEGTSFTVELPLKNTTLAE